MKRMKSKIAKTFASSLIVLGTLLMMLNPAAVYADTGADGSEGAAASAGTLTLEDCPLEGQTYNLYQISVKDEAENTFARTDAFTEDKAAVGDIDFLTDASEMMAAATTLDHFAIANGVAPYMTATAAAGEDGKVSCVFSGLKPGIYLVGSTSTERDGYMIRTSPVFAYLPATGEGGIRLYDLAVTVKGEKEKIPTPKTERTVYKVWKDDTGKGIEDHPDSIKVQLMAGTDGKFEALGDPVVLNADNGWKYTWKDLTADKEYKVSEVDVPQGYTCTIDDSSKKNTTVITNKKNTPPTPPKKDKKLPQTGQLWWPVPVIAAAGLLCILIGVRKGRGRNDR